MIINSSKDIISAIHKLDLNELSVDEVKFGDGLGYTLTLKGKNWDGKFDAAIAKIVIQIQDLIFTSYARINEQSLRRVKSSLSQDLRVTVAVGDGSSIINIDIKKALETLLGNLTQTQSFIALLLVIGAFASLCSLNMYLTHVEKMEARQLVKDMTIHDEKMAESFDRLAKTIVGAMQKSDTITISSTGEVLTRDELKARFPSVDSNSRTEYIDGSYKFFQLNTKNDYKAIIEDISGVSTKAFVMLSQNDLKVLAERLLDHEFVDVQINATVDDSNKIIEARIIKLDKPRADAISLAELK